MQFRDLKLLHLKAMANRNVFSLDLKEVRAGADEAVEFVLDMWCIVTECCCSMFSSYSRD